MQSFVSSSRDPFTSSMPPGLFIHTYISCSLEIRIPRLLFMESEKTAKLFLLLQKISYHAQNLDKRFLHAVLVHRSHENSPLNNQHMLGLPRFTLQPTKLMHLLCLCLPRSLEYPCKYRATSTHANIGQHLAPTKGHELFFA